MSAPLVLLVLALGSAGCGANRSVQPPTRHLAWLVVNSPEQVQSALQDAATAKRPTVVMVWAKWSVFAKSYVEAVDEDAKLNSLLADVTRIRIDVTRDSHADVCMAAGASSTPPAFALYDASGVQVEDAPISKWQGPPNLELLHVSVAALLEPSNTSGPQRTRDTYAPSRTEQVPQERAPTEHDREVARLNELALSSQAHFSRGVLLKRKIEDFTTRVDPTTLDKADPEFKELAEVVREYIEWMDQAISIQRERHDLLVKLGRTSEAEVVLSDMKAVQAEKAGVMRLLGG